MKSSIVTDFNQDDLYVYSERQIERYCIYIYMMNYKMRYDCSFSEAKKIVHKMRRQVVKAGNDRLALNKIKKEYHAGQFVEALFLLEKHMSKTKQDSRLSSDVFLTRKPEDARSEYLYGRGIVALCEDLKAHLRRIARVQKIWRRQEDLGVRSVTLARPVTRRNFLMGKIRKRRL